MALVIYSNIAHTRAENSLLETSRSLSTQLKRISSGLRVGSASDDAAGLAISERMETQVRGLGKAIQNAQDGVSLAQTASGAYQETTNILQRIRELTVQGVSEQLNQSDRGAIQAEIEQLKGELDRIGTIEFNGQRLFGEDYQLHLTDSTSHDGLMSVSTQKLSSGHLGRHVLHTAEGAVDPNAAFGEDALQIITADGEVVKIRGTSATDDSLSFYNPEGSAIAKAAAINEKTAQHGVTALVAPTVSVNLRVEEVTLDEDNMILINGVAITGFHVEESDVTGALKDAINGVYDETGVVASYDGQGRLVLTAEDGRNIFVETFGDGYLAGLNSGSTGARLTLKAADSFTLRFLDQATNEALGNLVPEIITAQTYQIADGSRALSPSGGMYSAGPSGIAGDLNTNYTLSGVGVGEVKSILNDEGKDLNLRSTGELLTFDSAGFGSGAAGPERYIELKHTISAGETATVELNILALGNFDSSEFYADIETSKGHDLEAPESQGKGKFNEDLLLQYSLDGGATWKTHSTLVDRQVKGNKYPPYHLPAVDPDGTTELERLESARIQRTVVFSQDYKLRIAQTGYTGDIYDHYGIVYGAISTTDANGGGEALIGESYEHSIESVSILTEEGRRLALHVVDQALDEVNEAQVALGAIQNRLEATINDLAVTRSSTMQSQSRIRDADFALEVAELSRSQIIQRANTEVLAQLASQPQLFLQLLQG